MKRSISLSMGTQCDGNHEELRNNHRTTLKSTSAEGDHWFLDQRKKSPICSQSEPRNGWQIEGHPFDLISRSFALPVNTCTEWEREFRCASLTVGVTAKASRSSFQVFDKFRINLCGRRPKQPQYFVAPRPTSLKFTFYKSNGFDFFMKK